MPKLTQPTLASYKAPATGKRSIKDAATPALYMVLGASGHRAWMMRLRMPDGRPAKLTLGPVHLGGEIAGTPVIGMPLTLRAARLLAADVLRQRAMGVDIAAETKARKVVRQEMAATSFGKTVRQFIVEHKVKRTRTRPRRWFETAALLGLYWPSDSDPAKTEWVVIKNGLAQRWATKPVADIDEAAVLLVLDEAKRRAVPGIKPRTPGLSHSRARTLHAALSAFFTWAKKERLLATNPMRELTRPEGVAARERVLTPDEIRVFWQATEKVGAPFGTIYKLLLLTGARLREIAEMRRSELDTDTLNLPSSRTKNKLPFALPLAPAALALIPANEHEIVFTTTGTTPPSGFSRAKERLDSLMQEVPAWRVHDLRRTLATGMHELGVLPHVVEACLNHISGHRAGVAGTYNRYAYLPEKRAALERWSRHVLGLVADKPQNVVPLKGKRNAQTV